MRNPFLMSIRSIDDVHFFKRLVSKKTLKNGKMWFFCFCSRSFIITNFHKNNLYCAYKPSILYIFIEICYIKAPRTKIEKPHFSIFQCFLETSLLQKWTSSMDLILIRNGFLMPWLICNH